MEKKKRIGVQKKPSKPNKRFIKAVVDYLTSDSYMYAPLISPPLDSPPSETRSSPAKKGVPVVHLQRLLAK